jgi:hypothetical protein
LVATKNTKSCQEMHDQLADTSGVFYLDEVSKDLFRTYINQRRTDGYRSAVKKLQPIGDAFINDEMAFVKRVMRTINEDRVRMPKKRQMDVKGAPTDQLFEIKKTKTQDQVANQLRGGEEVLDLIAENGAARASCGPDPYHDGVAKRKRDVARHSEGSFLERTSARVIQKGDEDHVISMIDDLDKFLRDGCGQRTKRSVFVFKISGCDYTHSKKTAKVKKTCRKSESITAIRTTFETTRARTNRHAPRFYGLRRSLEIFPKGPGAETKR